MTASSDLTPAMRLCEKLGINRRTLDRWLADPSLDFPAPIVINGRLFFEDDKTNAWKRRAATTSRRQSKPVKAPVTSENRPTAA